MNDESNLARTSLWSVPERWSAAYLWLFAVQALFWLGLLIFNESNAAQPVNIVGIAVNVGIAWAPLMVVSAGVSMLIVEVPMVFADKYLNYRYKLGLSKGIELGREEGRVEGREEGREVGALAEREVWERYLDEVDEARRTGMPEPQRPTANRNGSVRH